MDTGAAASLVSEEIYCCTYVAHKLFQATTVLRTCSDEQLSIFGCMHPLLSTVLRQSQLWPLKCSKKELKPFWFRRNELNLFDDCVL